MDVLNAKYIMTRSDIDWRIRNMREPQSINDRLKTLKSYSDKFVDDNKFGDLHFWKYWDWKDKTIYPAKNLIKASGTPKIEDVLQLDYQDVLFNNEDKVINKDLIKSEIIHSSYQFELGGKHTASDFSFTDDLIFPAVRILPSNKAYPLILLKEKIEMALIKKIGGEILIKNISLLGKRLMEAEKELENNNLGGLKIALLSYIQKIKEVIPQLSDSDFRIDNKILRQEELFSVFKKHAEMINKFKNKFPDDQTIKTANRVLNELLIERGISPYFGYIDKPNYAIQGRKIYQFSVANPGSYELLIDAKSWDKYFKISLDEPLFLQVDKELFLREAIPKQNYISLGFFNFDQGKHEVAWNTPDEINLVEDPSELVLKTDHGTAEKSFAIHPFDPYSKYKLTFKYLINKGSGLGVLIEQNNEKYKKGKVDPQFFKYISADSYNFTDIKQFSEFFIPNTGADSARLVLKIDAWNNCKEAYKYLGIEKCNDEILRQRFDLPTEISITDVTLVKLMTEVPFLVKERKQESKLLLPRLSYTKINGAEYKVKVEDAKNPFIIVLSELFDPGWKIYSASNTELSEAHFLANTYSNGWLIDRTGTYDLSIKFMPQDILQKSESISVLSVVVGIIFLLWRFILKK